MGMYTGIRFKGYVKPEYRQAMSDIALSGDWKESSIPKFADFGKLGRSCFIPCGALAYMPDEWETDYLNEQGEKEIDFGCWYKQVATDGFDRSYNITTGYWTFQCSLKNYECEIEAFFELLPFFIETISYLEYYYEEMAYGEKYELIYGKVVRTDNRFISYVKHGYGGDLQ